ncbi:MAG: hypothetical protein L0Y56_04245 [Nitrospira sp.]|nr:hypothetical protein [Nitrospira sp.]
MPLFYYLPPNPTGLPTLTRLTVWLTVLRRITVGGTRGETGHERHGLATLPVNIDHSQAKYTIEGEGICLGFNCIDGFGDTTISRLIQTRPATAFNGPTDFCQQTRLPRRLVEHLVLAGAMDGWEIPRRQLLWNLDNCIIKGKILSNVDLGPGEQGQETHFFGQFQHFSFFTAFSDRNIRG